MSLLVLVSAVVLAMVLRSRLVEAEYLAVAFVGLLPGSVLGLVMFQGLEVIQALAVSFVLAVAYLSLLALLVKAQQLEQSHSGDQLMHQTGTGKDENLQLSFFQLDDPVLEQIKEELVKTDINHLTPVEALMKLNEIKKLVGGK